jgi:hypothetical protein
VKAITANHREGPRWFADFLGDTPDNRLDGRLVLREMGAVRFDYVTQYSITDDALVLRVLGYAS